MVDIPNKITCNRMMESTVLMLNQTNEYFRVSFEYENHDLISITLSFHQTVCRFFAKTHNEELSQTFPSKATHFFGAEQKSKNNHNFP